MILGLKLDAKRVDIWSAMFHMPINVGANMEERPRRTERMNDGFLKILAWPCRPYQVRVGPDGIDQLATLNRLSGMRLYKPAATGRIPSYIGHSRIETDAAEQVMVPCEASKMVVDCLTGDKAIRRNAFLLHGIKGVLEQRIAYLGIETGIDAFLAPDSPNAGAVVDYQ